MSHARRMRRLEKKIVKKAKAKGKTFNQLKADLEKHGIDDGMHTQQVSMCPEHGVYTPDNLCPCYDKGGSLEGVKYGEWKLNEQNSVFSEVSDFDPEDPQQVMKMLEAQMEFLVGSGEIDLKPGTYDAREIIELLDKYYGS